MDAPLSMNSLRIVLVGLTALSALVAAILGNLLVAGVLLVACAAHGGVWYLLHQQRTRELEALHAGVEELLRDA